VIDAWLKGRADHIVTGNPHLKELGEYEGIKITIGVHEDTGE